MSGIPVLVYLDGETFRALEGRAKRERTHVRTLIVLGAQHQAGTTVVPRQNGATHRRITAAVVDEWVRLVTVEGVTNGEIARRYEVSDALVSRRLVERGIRRKRAHS